MSPQLGRNTLAVALIASVLIVSSAQTLQKSKFKNLAANPESEHLQKPNRRNDHQQEKGAAQSPFTPPPDLVAKELTRPRTDPAPTTTVAAVPVDTKSVHRLEEKQVPNAGSPFSPPPNREWREQSKRQRPSIGGSKKLVSAGKSSAWLDSVEERQRDNVDSIPPLADISLTDTTSTASPRRRPKVRPKVSVYQEKSHRDIHEAEPGVTPWTRYTDKPRLKEEHSLSGKANARCGRHRYNPRNQICCDGQVARRHGLSPACCQGQAYDTVFNKCCGGLISDRANGKSDC